MNHLPTALLNTTIATANDGAFQLRTLTTEEAKRIFDGCNGWVSHIGHEATAQAMSTIFGADIKMNRAPLAQQVGQDAICMKLRGRIPEGTVLTDVAQIEDVGYDFVLMTRTA